MIARGAGRLLGFEIIWNFNQPYAATSITDFWRRWHISLSTWLRDYLYIPLGWSRRGVARTYVNLVATMLLGGLWHGAAWTFVGWGALHGAALAIERRAQGRRPAVGRRSVVGWLTTMAVVFVGWWLFRCRSTTMLIAMATSLTELAWMPQHSVMVRSLLVLSVPVVCIEMWQYRQRDLLAPVALGRWSFAALNASLVLSTFAMWNSFQHGFIYFQF